MKKTCPNCKTEVKKFWKSAVGGVILGFCPTCKRKVNLGRADGTSGAGAEAGKEKTQQKEKETGKAARRKTASGSNRKSAGSGAPVSPAPAKKSSGIGRAVRDFFEF